ncbi:hypothetical protein GCM10010528_19040 [Gordonia defluvii]|uniref:Uncharacterized protein n=1 Tax=Gordonia defluvii TaxID=283718 RepID=A0ABP6LEW7_9ACTN
MHLTGRDGEAEAVDGGERAEPLHLTNDIDVRHDQSFVVADPPDTMMRPDRRRMHQAVPGLGA